MTTWNPRANELFLKAAGLRVPDGRREFLDAECAADPALRAEVEALLEAHDRAGSFLEPAAPAPHPVATVEAPAAAERPGCAIGRYKLLEQIGEGGFGVVYMAEQIDPVRRKVALKVLKPGMDTRQVVARFEAERQALALMDHPHIAKVLDAGETGAGRPYFVMELVRGAPVTRFCDDKRLAARGRLELFVSVCRAVQHAHQKGVIHRDLKPSNVLVTLHDGTPVPKVIDFGIAKALGQQLTDKTLFTGFAQLIGTPLYMSPEQAEMSGLDVDTRSDIYSLGVLLYELLTGTTPLDGERLRGLGYDELRRVILTEEPPKPSTRISTLGAAAATVSANRQSDPKRLGQAVRGELDWIVMRCLEKDRNRRYESAGALASDVQRYLSDEPVQACPPTAWYRFCKFARRHRRAVATAAAAALAVVTAVTGLAVSNFLITREQQETAKALGDANAARDDLKRTNERERVEAYFRRIALAHAALAADDLGAARRFLKDCPADLRGWEWHYLMRFCCVDPVVIREGQAVHGVAFSPDGDRLATAGGDGTVRIRDSRTGKLARERKNAHQGFACCVTFHPHGNHLASVGADGRAKVWNLTADPPSLVFECPCDAVHPYGTAHAAAFSPLDPDHLAVGYGGTVTVWNWRTEKPVHTFRGHEPDRIAVAFSPDGRRLATADWRGTVRLWDPTAGGAPLHTFAPTSGNRHPVAALAFAPDGSRLAAASFERRVDVWDATTGGHLRKLAHPGGLVLNVAFSRDGLLASGCEDKVVRVWNADGRELLALRGHDGVCGCVAFSPAGLRLASAGSDGTLRLWDATTLQGDERQESASFEEHDNEVWSVAVNPAGAGVVSAGFNMPALVWDPGAGRSRARFDGHGVLTFCVAWSPDGRRVASAGSADGEFTLKVWNVTTGANPVTIRDPSHLEFLAVAFSPDGRHLVTGRGRGAVQVWDAETGRDVSTFGTHGAPVRGVAFSPDGSRLATVSADGEVKLWDAARLGEKRDGRQLLDPLPAHSPGAGLSVAFGPGGKQLVTAGKGHTALVWDVETRKVVHTLRGHTGYVYAVAVSPDGRRVATAGEDSTVKVWDGRTGDLLRSFRGHTGLVTTLVFLDDRTLISGSRDHTVKMWALTSLEDPGP